MIHTCQSHPDHDTAFQIWRDTWTGNAGGFKPDYLTQQQFEFAVREHEYSLLDNIERCPRCRVMFSNSQLPVNF